MFRKILIASMLMLLSTGSQAELFDRGGGMIYDDVLNITWLQDANQGDVMLWPAAVAWVDGLNYGGFDDWRLPSMDRNGDHNSTDGLFNGIVDCWTASEVACRDNELGYMFFRNLGGSPQNPRTGDQGLFTDIKASYWSSTEYLGSPGRVFYLSFTNGFPGQVSMGSPGAKGVWAVRDGDVISDTDADGVADSVDNCSVVANADQRDTDGDGYGNICDPDLNNDGTVNFADLTLWVPFFNTATLGDADFNGDGFANFADFGLIPDYFLQPPGPSGVAP